MIAVILAAGMGERLMPLTRDKPKTLLEINNTTIIERMVKNCLNNQIKEYLVVVGHNQEKVAKECHQLAQKYDVTFSIVENLKYNKTNTGVSTYLAVQKLKNKDFIIINGDNVFDEKIIENLLKSKSTAMIIDNYKQLNQESFKISIKGSIIKDMGKQIDIESSSGEFIGISKVASGDVELFGQILLRLTQEDPQQYYDIAYVELSRKSKVDFVYTNGLKWTEIDDINDFNYAKSVFVE
ncbi:sugar phosphate nucleotidyltransferase [Methanobacterium petrolearium]|uniref:phosphocholine cytidylyltransferase family protein n=1 Tax=Methanobacterium petrolearium TaxID=710190 RepID=UPI001AE662A6|nr:sugar phosphate nucleotidyltransferase [Methanobacterium petrolearium]MBP1945451.1 choline kinase [Methanobacterium petrolearium]BDZ71653.1 glucose-1-phosphate thymidylyltransferase [Methanobacterium petrolearium]